MINFFTIVLNGQPFINWHYPQMCQLKVPWQWHIVEGVALLVKDTDWSVARGGFVPESHKNYISIDGTHEYIKNLAENDHRIIHSYQNKAWPGKTSMCQKALETAAPGILWQIDVDELWTTKQFETIHQLFIDNPHQDSALSWCYYFVGPKLVAQGVQGWGNQGSEWRRIWRYRPTMKWARHEPPELYEGTQLVGEKNYFAQDFLESTVGRFQHLAYTTESQVRFKRDYYGTGQGYYEGWLRMQERPASDFPMRMHGAMGIEGDSPIIDHIDHMKDFNLLLDVSNEEAASSKKSFPKQSGTCSNNSSQPLPILQ